MPHDTVYSGTVQDLPTGQPLVLYLPPSVVTTELTALALDRHRVVELTRAVRDGEPVTTNVTLRGGGYGLAGRDVRGQYGLRVYWSRGGGLVQLGPTAVAEDGTDVAVPGHFVDLSWSQCNRLIKFLRTARDQAFGRPE